MSLRDRKEFKLSRLLSKSCRTFIPLDFSGALLMILVTGAAMKRAVRFMFILVLGQAGVGAQSWLESPPASAQSPTESIRARLNEAETLLKRQAPAEALKLLQTVLAEAEPAGDRALLMEVFSHTGTAYFQLNDYQQSLEYYQRALELSRELQNRFFEAQSLRGISQVYKNIGAYAESLNYGEQASAVYRASDDRQGMARTWITMGSVCDLMGDYHQALEYYRKAQAVFEELKDSTLYRLLNEIGITLKNLGRYQEALDSYALALEGSPRADDKYFQAVILNNIGVAYKALGQDERAIESYEQSLALVREMGERRGQSILLNNLGEAYKALGEHRRALDYLQQGLQVARQIGNRHSEGLALKNLGDVHRLLGDVKQARAHYEQALTLQREIGAKTQEGSTLVALADVTLREGDAAEALRLSRQALALAEETGSPELHWNAQFALARACRTSNHTEEALAHLRASIETINSIRARVLTDASKIGYLDARQVVFHELADLLHEQGQAVEALEVAEAARSRALIDLLADREITAKPADVARLAEIRQMEARLRAQARMNPLDEAARAELAQKRAAAENELTRRVRSLQDERGELASLIVAEPLSFQQIRAVVERLHATLIEYLVTEKQLFIWVIKPSGEIKNVVVRIGRERLRRMVRDIHEQLNNVDVAALRHLRPVQARLAELYRLTVAPVVADLPRESQELVYLIPHDVLFLVPFAALLDERGRYLVEKHPLVSVPSISVLRYTAEKKRWVVSPDKPHLLAVADPRPPESAGLGALPGARTEVRQISRLFPRARTTVLVDRRASESNVKRLSAGQTILHFAVHGLIYDDRLWESALLLSDGEGEDGWLKVGEAFGLDLHADLVVLSGCSTGLGKLSGDGMIGLTRAFLYAGTPSLVVSRWDVSDKATTYLMERFYKGLSHGLSKAQALRAAELAALRRFRHPALWAAFELVGEAR